MSANNHNGNQNNKSRIRLSGSCKPKLQILQDLMSKKYGTSLKIGQVVELLIHQETTALRKQFGKERCIW